MHTRYHAKMSYYNITVPSLPPQNVMVTSSDPASLNVSWQLPPGIADNGPVTGHVIQFTRIGSSNTTNMNVTSEATHVISGLVANVEYSIKVAAMNVTGTGPFSEPVIEVSGEDSKLN